MPRLAASWTKELSDVGEHRDHRALGFGDDLRDHLQGVLVALSERDEGDVRALARGRGADVADFHLGCDDLVAEAAHGRGENRHPLSALIGDHDP